VPDFSGFFTISTRIVDKVVDKPVRTARKARIKALFNKMHIPQAKINVNKIKYLKSWPRQARRRYAANSYNGEKQGITHIFL